ncbi:response regulator transcription factor [Ferrimicrobium acidiphilum]|uniref:Oxygen regulatory protein NreC n=1 Tax=Ferrimicrobium acidiphilum DSM 19497 TaxID=1121877 RepID=A0A0D8FX09_9ACTN|nr:response regulator transcription factor [Ferrimicrobium acidiphilum]KJE77798.1 oxygen regulatory protein NreC [Ferrimicrobium acidiphilum DSM 19497]
MIRLMLVDDQALIRVGLRVLLESADDIEVVAEAADGKAAMELLHVQPVDVVLMDIRMPILDGLAATKIIAADPDLTETRIIMLTTFAEDEYILEAIRNGASGFLVKESEPSELVNAVRVVYRGEALLSPSVTRSLIANIARRSTPVPTNQSALDILSDREREVLVLVGSGLSNTAIAEKIYLSPLTVKTHVSHIMSKLEVRDRAQLVVIAYETGLIRPSLS